MINKSVAELIESEGLLLQEIHIKGWVRTFRANRFIALNDGSCLQNIQCVVDFESTDEALLKRITTGASVHIKGELVESQGKGQSVEIQVNKIDVPPILIRGSVWPVTGNTPTETSIFINA